MSIEKTAVESTSVEPKSEVVDALKKARNASKSMLDACKAAAQAAASQLDVKLPLGDRINVVMICYREAIGGDTNVRSNFKDALTLLACESSAITIEHDGKVVHTTGRDALKLPKHAMKEAAKEVRKDNDLSRASGAGRKRKSEKAENASTLSAAALNTGTTSQRNVVINTVVARLGDADFFTELKAKLAEAGYTISKKSKSKSK